MNLTRLHIDKKSLSILQFGLPFIIVALLYTALYLNNAESGEYYIIMNTAKQLIEHAMMSLTLLIGGALLFDYVTKKHER